MVAIYHQLMISQKQQESLFLPFQFLKRRRSIACPIKESHTGTLRDGIMEESEYELDFSGFDFGMGCMDMDQLILTSFAVDKFWDTSYCARPICDAYTWIDGLLLLRGLDKRLVKIYLQYKYIKIS